GIRANGDKEAASSVSRLFTDRVLMEVPIVAIGEGAETGCLLERNDCSDRNYYLYKRLPSVSVDAE
ncbi:MAG: hypothetical protein KGQ51_18740, partial [Planctomycetes bacterium]|nr:hypothetical protein [Planctomycetota bacterium]